MKGKASCNRVKEFGADSGNPNVRNEQSKLQKKAGCHTPCGCRLGMPSVKSSKFKVGQLPADAKVSDLKNVLKDWGVKSMYEL